MRQPLMTIIAVTGMIAAATSARAATVNSSSRGWYKADGSHVNNNNYIVGTIGSTVYRNFYTFTLPVTPAGMSVASATLRTYSFDVSGNFSVSLFDFSGLASSLAPDTGAGAVGISRFADLGTGITYGSRSFLTTEDNSFLNFALNAAAISAINASSGASFVIGSTTNSEGVSGDYAFAGSGSLPIAADGNTQLIIEYAVTVPLPPAAWAAISGLACAGFVGFARRRSLG